MPAQSLSTPLVQYKILQCLIFPLFYYHIISPSILICIFNFWVLHQNLKLCALNINECNLVDYLLRIFTIFKCHLSIMHWIAVFLLWILVLLLRHCFCFVSSLFAHALSFIYQPSSSLLFCLLFSIFPHLSLQFLLLCEPNLDEPWTQDWLSSIQLLNISLFPSVCNRFGRMLLKLCSMLMLWMRLSTWTMFDTFFTWAFWSRLRLPLVPGFDKKVLKHAAGTTPEELFESRQSGEYN